jgi:hypothetical protein
MLRRQARAGRDLASIMNQIELIEMEDGEEERNKLELGKVEHDPSRNRQLGLDQSQREE